MVRQQQQQVQQQSRAQQQQQRQSVPPSVQNLVFGDFLPEDLKTMQLNQQGGLSHPLSIHASCQAEQSASLRNSNADAAAPSWWGSFTGAPAPDESQQEGGGGRFNLAQAAAQWSEALLPGVVFASDWTAQHAAQTHSRLVQQAPKDLLERRQRAGSKQKLA